MVSPQWLSRNSAAPREENQDRSNWYYNGQSELVPARTHRFLTARGYNVPVWAGPDNFDDKEMINDLLFHVVDPLGLMRYRNTTTEARTLRKSVGKQADVAGNVNAVGTFLRCIVRGPLSLQQSYSSNCTKKSTIRNFTGPLLILEPRGEQ